MKRNVYLYVNDDLHQRIRLFAVRTRRTINDVYAEAARAYLVREEPTAEGHPASEVSGTAT